MNDTHLPPAWRWLRLAALSPLLAAAASLDVAIALAIALPGTLLFTAGTAPMIRRYVPDHQRPIAIALVGAVVATAIGLLLQAFCYRIAQPLQDWLPLLAVLPLLLERTGSETEAGSIIPALRNALVHAAAFDVGILAGAGLRLLLPPDAGIAACLIASGLALALVERFAPSKAAATDTDTTTPRTRARVSGPLR